MSALPFVRFLCLGAALALAGCKGEQAKSEGSGEPEGKAAAAAEGGDAAKAEGEAKDEAEPSSAATAQGDELDRLFVWLSPEPIAVAYDRLAERLDPSVVAVVFSIPPMAADLLDERATLDEGLDVVFDGEAEPGNWLGDTSLAFTVALSKAPYFIRPLTKPHDEVAGLLEQGGFTKNTIDEVEVWLPGGSFPWRGALLEGDVAAFIPVDVPGAGLEPLGAGPGGSAAKGGAEETGGGEGGGTSAGASIKAELSEALSDKSIELVLVSGGPLVHFDVRQPIAQVQFALRKVSGPQVSYEGQIRLQPTGDPDEVATDLHASTHPEENQQVQALIGAVEFVIEQGGVVGRLAITPDQLKHFVDR
jgi:hypothetical protein